MQTPQCFRKKLILKVLPADIEGTDEIGMVLETFPNSNLTFVKGDPSNLKITSPTDIIIASSLLEAK